MKIPPNKPDSEKAILGALMQRNELFFEIPMPEADDFYHQGNKTIFKAICGLFGKNVAVDIVTVLSELKNQKKLDECGGAVYIAGLTDFLTAGVEYHVEQVKSAAVARKIGLVNPSRSMIARGRKSKFLVTISVRFFPLSSNDSIITGSARPMA